MSTQQIKRIILKETSGPYPVGEIDDHKGRDTNFLEVITLLKKLRKT